MKAALQITVPFPIAKLGGWTQQKAVGVKWYVTVPHLLLQPSRGKSNTWWSKHMNTLVTVEGPWHQHTLKLLHDCHYLVCVQCIMSFTLVVLEHVTWHVSMCMHVTGQILAGPAFLCSQHLCISCASVNILVEWLSMGSRHDHCSGHVTFLLNCSVILSVTFLTLMLWTFLLWFLALTNVLERPCWFETTHHLIVTFNSLQWNSGVLNWRRQCMECRKMTCPTKRWATTCTCSFWLLLCCSART